jgi:hypothetical protein
MRRLVFSLSLILAASGAYADTPVTIMGQPSCGEWVAQKKLQWNNIRNQSWLAGYLSGLSVAYNADVLKRPDLESLALWMENFCKANPLVPVSTGGTILFEDLKAQMARQR